jgi:hypothetical protein
MFVRERRTDSLTLAARKIRALFQPAQLEQPQGIFRQRGGSAEPIVHQAPIAGHAVTIIFTADQSIVLAIPAFGRQQDLSYLTPRGFHARVRL